jgi:predicted  nucleic acid-binding Zn-ribbon protein
MVITETFETLKTLQDILSRKIMLEYEIQENPKVLTSQEEVLARLKKSFIEKSQEFEKIKITQAEFQNTLFEAERSREQAEKNMGATTTQREFEALDKEIKDATLKEQACRRDIQREERILSELDESIKQIASMIDTQEIELVERRTGIEAEITRKRQEIAELLEQEQGIVSGIDAEVLFKFERIVRNKMGKGIVAIKGGVCTGCHMILPAQFANDVHMGQEIVFCPYCSRILFYEESDQNEEDFFYNEEGGSLSDLDDLDDEEEFDYEEEDKLINIDSED